MPSNTREKREIKDDDDGDSKLEKSSPPRKKIKVDDDEDDRDDVRAEGNGKMNGKTSGHGKKGNGSKAFKDDDDDDEDGNDREEEDDDDDDDDEEDNDDNEEDKEKAEETEERDEKAITTFVYEGQEYSYKERPAVIEEREGKIEFRVVNNDNSKENLMILTGLKNIFQKQLPKMPREYIARLVYDRSHLSMAVVRKPLTVVGGITYRPFDSRKFAEIVFCAISSTEQVRGYGAHLMNHLKDYVKATSPVMHFLTYADNYAIGYFKKQGFTKEVTLPRSVWMGYIKDYEGGTIMHCAMLPRIRYLDSTKILAVQKRAVLDKIAKLPRTDKVYPGLTQFKNVGPDHGITVDPSKIPGLTEAGWTSEIDALARKPKRSPHFANLQYLLSEMQNHPSSWPFAQAVSREEVPDYYEVIKEPMDLATMEQKLENDGYTTVEDFLYDARLIFNNCRSYNNETTTYYKNATKLEKFLYSKIKEIPEYSHLLD